MKVSIVTISFNQAPYLREAIESVLNQDYPDVEYIVVDPGSTDGSRDIIEEYRSKLAKLILEPDSGPADGLNKGFAAATGEILGYINADDAFLPGAINRAVKALKRHSEAGVVYADGYLFNRESRPLRRFQSNQFTPRKYVYGAAVVLQQSTFIRRSTFRSVGGFNADNRVSWDIELLVDASLAGFKMVHVPEYWSLFRIYRGSISDDIAASGKFRRQFDDHNNRMFEKVMGRAPRKLDSLVSTALRINKYVSEPSRTITRTRDAILGPPVRDITMLSAG